MNQLWQQEAARLGIPGLAQLVSDLRDGQLELMAHIDALNTKSAKQEAAITRLLAGFPADDVDGHRRYHESVIEWRELRNKMVREALLKLAQAGTLAAFGWLALAIWQAFKTTVTK
jgi:C4-dicarboxylate-specific signal transduction histidine kinase